MILLKNPVIITMDGGRSILRGRSILIDGDKIARIAEESVIRKSFGLRRCKVIDCRGRVVIPGLINSHTHVAMSFFKGLGHADWQHIYELMFPIERQLTGKDVYQLARLGILEMIKGGTTCFADHYYFIRDIAAAAEEFGMRAVLGHTLMDIKGPHRGPKEFAQAMSFAEDYAGNGLITPCLAPHATETVSPRYLKKIIETAQKKNALIHMHVAQTESEYNYIRKTYGCTPVKYLLDSGAFQGKFLGAHCIYLTRADVRILAKNNVSVAFTPSSEIVFEKLPPIKDMQECGVNIALGTDCVGTADLMSPLHEMKKAFYAIVQEYGPRYPVQPMQMLEMFTINAAKALGLDDRIGSIEENKLADLVILNTSDPAFTPIHDIAANTVLCAHDGMIEHVIINGKIMLADHKLAAVDEDEVMRSAVNCSNSLINKLPRKYAHLKQ